LTHESKIKLAAPAHILTLADSNDVPLAFYESLRLDMMRSALTGVDIVLAGVDIVLTGADNVSTAMDNVLTGLDNVRFTFLR
jgi:hypothetical protein